MIEDKINKIYYLLDPNDPNISSILALSNSSNQVFSSTSSSSKNSAAALLQDTILRDDLAVSPSTLSESVNEINIDYLSHPENEEDFMNLMIELNS